MRICTIENCDRKHFAKGVCRKHYDTIPERKAKNQETSRAWHIRNPEKVKKIKQKYMESHKEVIRERIKNWINADTPRAEMYRLSCNLRNRLRVALKNNAKSGSAVADLGCSIVEFKIYLEAKFQPGMTWENYGKGYGKWCIDHTIPLARFNLTDRGEFEKAMHFSNMQPLWWEENNRKGKF